MQVKKFFILALIALMIGSTAPLPLYAQELQFNINNIISDSDFFNVNTMSESDIQRFLESKGSFLATYKDPLTYMTPARIIHNSAQQYGINPQVILTTIQKEQSGIENGGNALSRHVLDKIMGYGYCDACSTADVDPDLLGFFNQIKFGTAIFDKYKREIEEQGITRSGFGPGVAKTVDGETVVPANIATAALLTFTPHEHGNKNFFTIWNRWFSLAYPDGTLLQAEGEPAVFVIHNGLRRGFQSLAALTTRGYNTDRIITVASSEIEKYSEGPALKYPQYALFEGPHGDRYLYVNETKRHIVSNEVFRDLGFNPEELDLLSQEDLDAILNGKDITLNDAYPTGALLQNNSSGSVYFVEGGVRYPIIHKSVMTERFGEAPALIQVDGSVLKNYVIGTPLKLPEGTLVMSDSGASAVYVVSNGQIRPIASATTFETLNYDWEDIVGVPDSVLNIHPTGQPLNIDSTTPVELATN